MNCQLNMIGISGVTSQGHFLSHNGLGHNLKPGEYVCKLWKSLDLTVEPVVY